MTIRDKASKKVIAAIVILLVAGSIVTASWLISITENNSEIDCMLIGPSRIESGYIQVEALFSPFTDQLKLTYVECDPMPNNLQVINNVTGNDPYEEWFSASLLYDIYAEFISGTGYQFAFHFIDEYGKNKIVYLYVPFSPDSETNTQQNISDVVISTTQNSEVVGNQLLFWTPTLEGSNQALATLLAVGNSCYVYMANSSIDLLGEENSISKCEGLRNVFDETIYPKAIELAGNPDGNLGDIDNDPRITLFLFPMVRTMGQAYLGTHQPRDELPGPLSNEREMIYIDSEKDLNETICITIHEFNHLIWDNYEFDEADFLTEGLANYAIDYTGYWWYITDAVTRSFTNYPEVSLLYFNRFYSDYWDASYGQGYLFVTYLAEKFGVETVRSLVTMEEDAALAVEKALSNTNNSMSFNDVYLDWVTACVLDNPSIEDGKYGFLTQDYVIQRYSRLLGNWPVERKDVRHNLYGMNVKKIFNPQSNFTFEIENPYPYALGIVIAVLDADGWRVNQLIRYSVAGSFSEYVEGHEIEEVNIITCVMSADTPTDYHDVFALDEIPHVNLDYSIRQGIITNYSQIPFFALIIGLPTVVVISAVIMVKYRRVKYVKSTNLMRKGELSYPKGFVARN